MSRLAAKLVRRRRASLVFSLASSFRPAAGGGPKVCELAETYPVPNRELAEVGLSSALRK